MTAAEDTRLLVNWTEPYPSHGPIKAYQVIYRTDVNGQLTQSVQLTSGITGRWIKNLQPYTIYEIQVRFAESIYQQQPATFSEKV